MKRLIFAFIMLALLAQPALATEPQPPRNFDAWSESPGKNSGSEVLWDENLDVVFPDPNLEAVVRDAIDKPEGPINIADLEQIERLSSGSKYIKDITGLEYCTNLEYLNLDGNDITDVSPLAGLTAEISY